jgi:UDP-N-acetylmuramyl tripeptide synthase
MSSGALFPGVVLVAAAAIERAIALARPGDVVALVNRGPRTLFLDREGRTGRLDDRAVVRELIETARAASEQPAAASPQGR